MSTVQSRLHGRRLSEAVYENITQMIVRGELRCGQSISESDLSRRLAVSRTPVHEAISRLIQDGLVIQRQNRRPIVASFGTEDIYDIYEMRRVLESEAAAKAASRIDHWTLAKLEQAAEKFKAARVRQSILRRWVEFDDQFHSAIAAACGSPRLEADIRRYRLLHRVFNRTHNDPKVLEQAFEEHARIQTALEQRDETSARAAMNDHLAQWQRFFVQHLA